MSIYKIPLSVQIISAMFVGLLLGYILATPYSVINNIANAFVTLLQMTVLPYITLSLIVGLGGLSPDKAKKVSRQSLAIIFIMILVVLFFIFSTPLAFPDWQHAEFYSVNTIKVAEEFNLVSLFISANPFSAFANTLIPAVVFFSICLGLGLMQIKSKRQTLLVLSNLQQAVANINNFIMKFAPLGVFCIGWRAAVTIDASQFDGLVVYMVSAIVLVILLCFIVFPAVVATVTPFGYREIVKVSREPMLTAFATGSFFSVIPIIVEKTKKLIKEKYPEDSDLEKISDVIVPISFSLPVGGKLLALLFVLFAAWFTGAQISFSDYINLVVAGLPQLFGSTTLAMQNLLDLFNVSGTMFDFYLVAENLLAGRLSAVFSVVFSSCLPLLIATAMLKRFTIKWRNLARNLAIIPLVSLLAFISLRFSFDSISHQYQGYTNFIERDFLFNDVESTYLDKSSMSSETRQGFSPVLTRIKQRGFIRVGYFRDDLPYAFHNNDGKLVGFDIEIMNQLAIDLGINIEFVKIFHHQAEQLLQSGYLDITTGIPVIPDNMIKFTLTVPYSQQSLAFIVKDERRVDFKEWAKIIKNKDLIIGIPETFFYQKAVERNFIYNDAWKISTPRLFFKEKYQHIDGMLFGAAAASAWTLLHPEYTVVVPKPILAPLSMAFPINNNDQAFELFMRNWIEMKQQSKVIDKLFNYWISNKRPLTII
ncbi:MAG: cation:dicarboxylase symporter family transporter [Colwellia sp.]|nr:cation:dicarboxylase symporter family transporter [Colwellia sp.]